MEELTLDQLPTVQEPEPLPPLVELVQSPVIVEHLHREKASIEAQVAQATSLVCSPETVAAVKATRAELNKRLTAMEAARKRLKGAIMAPYEKFEAVYAECVSGPLKAADAALKEKIAATESAVIEECRKDVTAYFLELIQAEGVEWLTFDQLGLKIGMTEAKQKTRKKIKDAVLLNVQAIAQDVKAIAEMPDAAEIMAEYRKLLSLARAVDTVKDRHRRIEEERKRQEEQEAHRKAEAEAVAKVEAAAPIPAPAPIPKPTEAPTAPEKIYKLTFAVHGTRSQLVQFKRNFVEYCEKEGIRYE